MEKILNWVAVVFDPRCRPEDVRLFIRTGTLTLFVGDKPVQTYPLWLAVRPHPEETRYVIRTDKRFPETEELGFQFSFDPPNFQATGWMHVNIVAEVQPAPRFV